MLISDSLYKGGRKLLPILLLAFLVMPAIGAEGASPQIMILEPKDNSTLPAGDIMVSVDVKNFTIVDNLGGTNVAGEGHIHYYMDARVPTNPDKPALTMPGTYAPTVNTSFTWKNVSAGMHNFSAELVNNDHTPIMPLAIAQVNVTVEADALKTMSTDNTTNVTVNVTAKNIAFNVSTITVPAGSEVTVNFDNLDASVDHNIAFYETSAAEKPIYVGKIFKGPALMAYKFKAPDTPGTYFFRCDVHPYNMYGQFIVK